MYVEKLLINKIGKLKLGQSIIYKYKKKQIVTKQTCFELSLG